MRIILVAILAILVSCFLNVESDSNIQSDLASSRNSMSSNSLALLLSEKLISSSPSHQKLSGNSKHCLNKFYRCGSFVDQRDMQEYPWVEIGNQIWMAKNLNYNTYNETHS